MTTEPDEKPSRRRRLWTALRAWGPGSARAGAALTQAEKVRLMYDRFREILNLNDSTLQLIADLEDRLSGLKPFALSPLVQKIRRAAMDVFVMVKDLNQIAGGRYSDLYETFRRLDEDLEIECAGLRPQFSGPLVMALDELTAGHAGRAGTKMANLGEVRNLLGLAAPEGFVITTAAFARFMSQNDLWERTDRLEEILEVYGPRSLAEACREVQLAILAGSVPEDVAHEIQAAYAALVGSEEILVAMRSSALGEDRAASHAGQYYTELNVGRSWLLDAYRSVIASAFSQGAVSYRFERGRTAAEAAMAVGCLRMLRPRCSGIMFSRNFQDPEADQAVISAVAEAAADVAWGKQGAEEIVLAAGAVQARPGSCLQAHELELLRRTARRLEAHFGGPQDIEWAIDPDGRLFILQCRSMLSARPVERALPAVESDRPPLLSGGLTACRGIGSGPAVLVRTDDELDRFPQGGVLVARHSSPSFSRVMRLTAAIVTDVGSPSGHMAILAREFEVPAIVGMEGATATLQPGQVVTVDANSCKLYEGEIAWPESAVEIRPALYDSPAVLTLRHLSRLVTPLHLIDPGSREFKPALCQSLHDLTRFVHEKVFEVMFYLGDQASADQQTSLKLQGSLPYDILVLDVGGGIAEGARTSGQVRPGDILSAPMQAFLQGLLDPRIRWDQPRAVSTKGFLSVLGQGIAGPPAEAQGVGRISYAIISDRYMNFSTKAGYHFNTVDTYCGKSLNKNYIHFRFTGGAASEERRARRVKFLSSVLGQLDFKVQSRGDILVARLEKYEHDFIRSRLSELGRLTLCARQLDMLMDSEASPDYFARAFLAGQMEKF